MTASKTLVIGIGNEFRNDDSFGLVVASRLAGHSLNGVEILTHHGEGTGLMSLWQDHSRLVVIDAVSSNSPPGTIHLIDVANQALPPDWSLFSSHAFGLAQAIELSRDLGCLPRRAWVVGGEGEDFSHGQALSPALVSGVDIALEQILTIIRATA